MSSLAWHRKVLGFVAPRDGSMEEPPVDQGQGPGVGERVWDDLYDVTDDEDDGPDDKADDHNSESDESDEADGDGVDKADSARAQPTLPGHDETRATRLPGRAR